MSIEITLYLGMIITGASMGILIDWFANKLIENDDAHSAIGIHIFAHQSQAEFEEEPEAQTDLLAKRIRKAQVQSKIPLWQFPKQKDGIYSKVQ